MSTIENTHDKRLRLASRLDREDGADDARIAYIDTAGWSVRELVTLADQRREGALLHNCLYRTTNARANLWSLRDPDNLPHITFAAWRLASPEEGEVEGGIEVCCFSTGSALVSTHLALSTFEDAHVERLATCAEACADQFVPMPNEFEWLRQMAQVHGVRFGLGL